MTTSINQPSISKSVNAQFAHDVKEGLSQSPKALSSKYFYDDAGSALFAQIMNLKEYYLTNAEYEILSTKSSSIISDLELSKDVYFELIELGAGDGKKTIQLLKALKEKGYHFDYLPIDISKKAFELLESNIAASLPDFNFKEQIGDYFDILHSLSASNHPKLILYLGSNIGNLSDTQAQRFLNRISSNISKGDNMILGVDLKKSEKIVLPAYNDSSGVTKRFNLNLLTRINRELGGDFDINQFEHRPQYNESKGVARSFLVSKIDQEVQIKALGMSFQFVKNEPIATEISRKYDDQVLHTIIENTGFRLVNKHMDSNAYFANYLLEKVQ